MGTLIHDLRFALRLLWKNPGFTTVAVVALALGIGANSTIFSLANSVFLRPLPVSEPNRLVWLFNDHENPVSYPDYLDYGRQADMFSAILAYDSVGLNMGMAGPHLRVLGIFALRHFSSLLG